MISLPSLRQSREHGDDRNERISAAVRRTLDIIFALFGLSCLAPVFLVVAFAIRIEGNGPIFFSQLRIGQNGRPFRLYKFRKFTQTSCPGNNDPVTLANDRRMTQVGRVLSRTKLDELPQLWNVLIADMSVVGPRPETFNFSHCFSSSSFEIVLRYRPGLFGPNQTFFRNEAALYPFDADPVEFYCNVLFPLKARVDLAYFPHRTFWMDLHWIIQGTLSIMNCSALTCNGPNWVENVENWIGRRSRYVGRGELDGAHAITTKGAEA